MTHWPSLCTAIGCEVAATLALRAALDHPGWYALVITGYVTAFVMLDRTLRAGTPLGVAYGIWGAGGVALTAVGAMLLFGEPLHALTVVGLVVVIAGVLLVELGSPGHDARPTEPAGTAEASER